MAYKDKQSEKIIAATLALVAQMGAAAVTMAAIAEKADISRQTLYNHFPDVAAVIEAALDAHGAAMEAHLEKLVNDAETPQEKLTAVARFMVEAVGAGHAGLDLEAALPAEARARLAAHAEAPRRILTRVLAEAGGHDDPAMGDFAWSMIEAGAAAASRHPDAANRLTETLIRALMSAHGMGDEL